MYPKSPLLELGKGAWRLFPSEGRGDPGRVDAEAEIIVAEVIDLKSGELVFDSVL
jgi:hypothetical protein